MQQHAGVYLLPNYSAVNKYLHAVATYPPWPLTLSGEHRPRVCSRMGCLEEVTGDSRRERGESPQDVLFMKCC